MVLSHLSSWTARDSEPIRDPSLSELGLRVDGSRLRTPQRRRVPLRSCLGIAFVRILVRDHTDGGTGETEWGWKASAATLFGPPSIALAQ
jgi:hypothetical protein